MVLEQRLEQFLSRDICTFLDIAQQISGTKCICVKQTDSKQSSATQLEIRRIMANFRMKVTHSFGEVF